MFQLEINQLRQDKSPCSASRQCQSIGQGAKLNTMRELRIHVKLEACLKHDPRTLLPVRLGVGPTIGSINLQKSFGCFATWQATFAKSLGRHVAPNEAQSHEYQRSMQAMTAIAIDISTKQAFLIFFVWRDVVPGKC